MGDGRVCVFIFSALVRCFVFFRGLFVFLFFGWEKRRGRGGLGWLVRMLWFGFGGSFGGWVRGL